jgi:cytochrome c oxidase cbb3-type subunit I
MESVADSIPFDPDIRTTALSSLWYSMSVTDATLREASSRNDELIDADLIRQWLACGLGWLLLFPTIGAFVSTKFNYPTFLGDVSWLTFGRLRPMHVNGVIWGAFSTLFIGLCYYIVPRLTGVRVWGERWSRPLLWIWNLNIAAAVILLALGWNRGWEAGEFPLINVLVIFFAGVALTVQFLMTIKHRRERPLYVSLWYLIAAFVWTDVNLILLMLGPYHIPGINNAAWHGLFIHYVVGLWITPAGYVLIYYFLPASVQTPIYSHRLSLIGFWSLAFFYPFVGIHHYLYSPIADWAETIAIVSSMMLIIPVWTVLQNFFGTMIGRWHNFSRNLPAKFLIVGSIMYLVGCFQGSLEALRSLQQPTHFTDFVISHSHLTVFGTFVIWAIAGTVYVWPRLPTVRTAGRRGAPPAEALWSFRVGNWGFWLITLGISAMGLVLTAQGLQQGFMLMAGTEWVHSMNAIRPYWWVRTLTGISMDLGMSLVVYTLMKTSLGARSA